MTFFRQWLGRSGEQAAAAHLKRIGYKILARNFSCHLGELDLICSDGDTIVFVEVKSRTTDDLGDPEDAITADKQRRLHRVAQAWLAGRGDPERPYRFDAVSVVARPSEEPEIRHIIEAFIPNDR